MNAGLSTRELCDLLNVSWSSYYHWHGQAARRGLSAAEESKLLIKIKQIFYDSQQTYGSPRVWRQLLKDGVACSRRQVARIMRNNGLISVHFKRKRKFVTTTDSGATSAPAPNLLKQDFGTTAPNQKWVGDVTYVRTAAGWAYLANVMDLFSRKIVGYAIGARNNAQLTCAAFKMAVLRRQQPSQLIYHSDRGSNYACSEFKELLRANRIRPSMSRRGNCYDNAVAESFFHTFKVELIAREDYKTRFAAWSSITHWIEHFYNTQRMHSAIGYCSPVEFERVHADST